MEINISGGSYPIYIRPDFNDIPAALSISGLMGKRALIITDSNADHYRMELVFALSPYFTSLDAAIFPAGENNKTMATLEYLLTAMYDAGLDRASAVISLGGGVVGDLAALAASLYMRGIPYAALPTTTLACADSSVGGKNAIDFNGAKNIIGTFHQPAFVYMNVSTLATLSHNDYISGLAEVTKHAIIKDEGFFDYISSHKAEIAARDTSILTELFHKSCQIKAFFVERDERDHGIRQILNYGHTFGHAIESAADYTISHGFCVSLGMICAMHYAEMFPSQQRAKIIELLQYFGLPTKLPIPLTAEAIYANMRRDKKAKSGDINLIIADKIGQAAIIKGNPDKIISAISMIM